MEQQLRMQDRRATSLDGLWADIKKIRNEMDQGTVDRMILSMVERREAVTAVHGAATRW